VHRREHRVVVRERTRVGQRLERVVAGGQVGGVGEDPASTEAGHWELYDDDFAAPGRACTTALLRTSIEWSRIFPNPTDLASGYDALKALADPRALSHYHAMFAAMHARGLTPLGDDQPLHAALVDSRRQRLPPELEHLHRAWLARQRPHRARDRQVRRLRGARVRRRGRPLGHRERAVRGDPRRLPGPLERPGRSTRAAAALRRGEDRHRGDDRRPRADVRRDQSLDTVDADETAAPPSRPGLRDGPGEAERPRKPARRARGEEPLSTSTTRCS